MASLAMNIEMKTDVGEEQGHGKNNGRTLLRVNVVEKNFDRSSNSSYPSDSSLSREYMPVEKISNDIKKGKERKFIEMQHKVLQKD
ncbi:hypothetical protein V1477_008692 [Vespula maculifrons]|uniref:Uncharacterized protein n=1 Tax=Vespula maculifrons TaxID=7453 RepID=A0ABD2CDS6_VESMC